MKNETQIVPASDIAPLIRSIRGQRVILDNDLAALYGVATKRLNEQYRRNLDRFPEDFGFQLTQEEWAALIPETGTLEAPNLRSQNVTSKTGGGIRPQFATASKRNIRYLPLAFTEHGALMAANILHSPRAVAMSVYVIRAFVKMREDLAANAAILKRLAEIDKNLLLHDGALRDIYQKLRPLLEPPPPPPKPQIGFHVKEDAVPYRIKRRRAQP